MLSCVCIVPDGDLHLEVGNGNGNTARQFVVCSKALARASPFWKSLLYGGYAESQQPKPQDLGSKWVVKLPVDDPEGMELLLNIIHGRFELVPGSDAVMPLTKLYELCVITDKYNMTHVLRPWANGWWRSVAPYLDTHCHWPHLNAGVEDFQKRLWISWELGDEYTFRRVAQTLLLNYSRPPSNQMLQPPGIYENITYLRRDTILKLLTPFQNIVAKLNKGTKEFCKRPDQHNTCIRQMYESLAWSFYKNNLWPIPKPETVSFSLVQLVKALKECKIVGEEACCSITEHLKKTVGMNMDRITRISPGLVSLQHRNHLEAQRKKSGVILEIPQPAN